MIRVYGYNVFSDFGYSFLSKKLLNLVFVLLQLTALGQDKLLDSSTEGEVDSLRLRTHVEFLSALTPPREYSSPDGTRLAENYITEEWQEQGFVVCKQSFKAYGQVYNNVLVEIGPDSGDVVVIGAHYDVCGPYPGADDNASGVAGLLELTRLLSQVTINQRLIFVAYALEEPPFFGTDKMGSYIHAKSLKDSSVNVKYMLSLEMIGYYNEEKGSQKYPLPAMKALFPNDANFIAVIGKMGDNYLGDVKKSMQDVMNLPVVKFAGPTSLAGIDYSDHRNYWAMGFRGFMITDTSFYRNANYHTKEDTPDTLNYSKMADVVKGVMNVLITPIF